MRSLLVIIFLCFTGAAFSQYYYNDIITTKQTNKQYKLLKDNNIQQVTAKSFEADGTESDGFSLTQQLSQSSTIITTNSKFPSTGETITTSWYNNNKIKKSIDSTDKIKSTTLYTYNNNDLLSISTITEDAFMNNSSTELHQWIYDNNVPVKMLLIKNSTDTTFINFKKDEHGNVAEERWVKKNATIETYYYYYDEQQNITDIVRFNTRARRLLPDFTFEFDNKAAITQMIQVPQGSADYLIWQYIYNSNGLKQAEHCYSKTKQPIGRIEYTYK